MSLSPEIDTKLSAARARLILDKPFLGALTLRMPLVRADAAWCATSATDARSIYVNVDYIKELSLEQAQFVLAHEALHCALSHFARRQHRVKHRWDLACDFAVNPLLINDGLTPPPDALYLKEYEGMTAEEIYPLIDDNPQQQTHDHHIYDADDGARGPHSPGNPDSDRHGAGAGDASRGAPKPPPLDPVEREQLETQWQQRLAAAAQQAMRAGKLSDMMARMVDHLLQPRLPWRALLARYMSLQGRDDFNYARPSRREGEAILPSLRSAQTDIVIGVDTSGSISATELNEFLSEVNAIKGQIRARITVLPCDAAIGEGAPWIYEPWETINIPAGIHGGGGTSFVPVFDWIDKNDTRPDLVLYFTDANGQFPAHAPRCPVVWLVKGSGRVPWGERIQLN